MKIMINGGCIALGNGKYSYTFDTNAGIQSYTFSAARKPQIGDTIESTTSIWTAAVLPIINNDMTNFIRKRKDSPDCFD